ncbi:MAG: F0F1 ATP synthase subunit B [Alphaproteobacteria bacterium]
MEMLHNPMFWVSLSFVMFMAFALLKFSGTFVGSLDKRSARIRQELEEAKRLRMEAEAVLADYKQKQARYLKEAEDMLAKSRVDAAEYARQAERDLQASLDTRMKQAVEKIAQEEANAIEEVRNHVVDISLAAARSIIIEHMGNISQDELTKIVISDIGRKVH